jgi:signal transduction histidine kinase
MELHAAERRRLERQVSLARPFCLAMAFLVLELGELPAARGATLLLAAYLGFALFVAIVERSERWSGFEFPLTVDVAALAVFIVFQPPVVAFWFPYLFVVYAIALRRAMRGALWLGGLAALAFFFAPWAALPGEWLRVISAGALAAATFAAGALIAFLADGQRRRAADQGLLERVSSMLQVEKGLAESLTRLLSELAGAFGSEQAVLVFVDANLERIFVWRVREGETGRVTPESFPLAKRDAFLLDEMHGSVCWNSLEAGGEGFAWDLRDGKGLREVPRLPETTREEMNVRSLLAATFDFNGQPVGRILVLNRKGKFYRRDLQSLEQIIRHLGPQLENLMFLRHLRARAIEAERGRISRDLHDGILQSLLSFHIQLDVLRRKLPEAAEPVGRELAALDQMLRGETEELRRTVTDLRPLRVESADLIDVMQGFAERFRQETGIGLDLLADRAQLDAPASLCREVFQIYREALHNVKKHSGATHVVVKVWQDEAKLFLVVDDNGQGFSFAGCFRSEELDRLRLGPISIKERTRTVGGVLTVESNPGHGARLTVEIPLG